MVVMNLELDNLLGFDDFKIIFLSAKIAIPNKGEFYEQT